MTNEINAEPTLICPSCKTEIKLTESLAAPILDAAKVEFKEQLAAKDSEMVEREEQLKVREEGIAEAQGNIEDEVEEKLKSERKKIAKEESRRAQTLMKDDIEQQAKEVEDLQAMLHQKDAKLAEAQKTQATLMKKERDLDDAKRELDLTVEKRIQEGLEETRKKAQRDAEDLLGVKVQERDKMISDLQIQIEEMRRKAEQGSQQLQGEVLELELEATLETRFPQDTVVPVPKGEFGGDVFQTVVSPLNQVCGTILWESKQTKNWSDKWLEKLRDDQRAARAEVAVIVSRTLPKGVDTFDLIDGVWVVHPRSVLPVATCLRESLIEVASVRQSSEGLQTKTEMVYQYLTGSQFRQRIEAIVEAFTTMEDDLKKEKRVTLKQWAKREKQIERVMGATVGMYGDLQGIAGKGLQEIEGLAIDYDKD